MLNSFVTRGAVGAIFSAVTTGMSSDQLNAVANNSVYFNGGVTGNVGISSAQSPAQITSLLTAAPVNSVYADATGMDSAQLNAVAAQSSKIIDDGITGTMIVTSAIVDANLSGLLGKTSLAAIVEVNASLMVTGELSTIALQVAKVDEIYNLTLLSDQTAAEITTLLGKSVAAASVGKAMAVASATSMDADRLNALGASYLKIAGNGISGTVLLVSGSTGVTDANITNLFVKIDLGANVRADGTGMIASTISILNTNLAKLDSAFDMAFTNAQSVTELSNILGKSDAASATADATGMDSNVGGKLATLADNYLKLANAGVDGAIAINSNLTSVQISNLLSKVNFGTTFVGGATVAIDATGMSNLQLTSVVSSVTAAGSSANQAAVFDISNLTLTGSQDPTQMAILLNSTLANEAVVVATGMDSDQLAAVGNAPGAVDAVTGTFTITSDLSAAQIAAIMGNTAPTATVTIDNNGMSPSQQAAVVTSGTGLLMVNASATVATGQTFVVLVDMTGLPTSAVGMMARVNYDTSKVLFVRDSNGDGDSTNDSIGGIAFPTELFVTQGVGYVSFSTGVDIAGSGAGVTFGNAARLTFRSIAPDCLATELVTFATTGFTNQISATGGTATVPFVPTNFSNVTSLNNLQLVGVPASNIDVAADAGTTAGAAIAVPTVTATNNCGAVTPVIRTVTYPDATTSLTWPAMFPIGVSSVTWTATDAAGNFISATKTYTVQNYQLATIDVDLVGGVNSSIIFNQIVRLRLSSGAVVSATIPFTGNNGAVVDAQVPVSASYTCVSVKDATHTLADSQSLSVVGTKWVAGAAFALTAGDSNDDNVVDILDFGMFVSDRGAGKDPSSRSNFDRNAFVNNGDYGFISLNFLFAGDTCGGGYLDGNTPLARVSVKELRRAGLGYLEQADINMDGWVDQTDMGLAMQGQFRRDYPNALEVQDEVEVADW